MRRKCSVVRDATGAPDLFGSVALAMMRACLAARAAFVCLPRACRIVCASTRPRLVVVGVLYALAQVLFWLCALTVPSFSAAAVWVLGVLMGCCVIPLFVAWQGCYGTDIRSVLLYGSLVCLLTVAISLVILRLPAVPAAVLWCVCSAVGTLAPVFLPAPAAG